MLPYLRLVRLGARYERAVLAGKHKLANELDWHMVCICCDHFGRNWDRATGWANRGRNIVRKHRGLPLLAAHDHVKTSLLMRHCTCSNTLRDHRCKVGTVYGLPLSCRVYYAR